MSAPTPQPSEPCECNDEPKLTEEEWGYIEALATGAEPDDK